MATIPAGTIVSPQIYSVNTDYDSDIVASPTIAVFQFYGTAGLKYMVVSEVGDTQPLYTLGDSQLYVYKPSNTTYNRTSYDYYNDDDQGPETTPYDYDLGLGSRIEFIADETGWFVVIVAEYGTDF